MDKTKAIAFRNGLTYCSRAAFARGHAFEVLRPSTRSHWKRLATSRERPRQVGHPGSPVAIRAGFVIPSSGV